MSTSMMNLGVFVVVVLISSGVHAEGLLNPFGPWNLDAGPTSAEAGDLAQTEPLTTAMTDQPVVLVGQWPESLKGELQRGISAASTTRRHRMADVRESTYLSQVRFEIADHFDAQFNLVRDRNSASIFGGGISGVKVWTYLIPATASSAEISGFLADRLPEWVSTDPKIVSQFRRAAARALRPSICASLLTSLGFR